MTDVLNSDNKHIFLEETSNSSNSFIANLNKVVLKLNDIIEVNSKFSVDTINLLALLAHIDVPAIVKDLEKGSANGKRKLDIDFIRNFANYREGMTIEEEQKLWQTASAKVYYEAITVTFTDKSSIYQEFMTNGIKTPISTHNQLYNHLIQWTSFVTKYGYTMYNIIDSNVLGRNLLRITDGHGLGSTIDKITLHVASSGQNLSYDSVFQGAKQQSFVYTWVDTSSTLLTVADSLQALKNIADNLPMLLIMNQYIPDISKIYIALDKINRLEERLSKLETSKV